MSSVFEKLVWVQIIDCNQNKLNVELKFRNEHCSNKSNDIHCIVDLVKKKFPCLSDLLVPNNYIFECKSIHREDFWQSMSLDEEVSNKSDLKCTILKQLPPATSQKPLQHSTHNISDSDNNGLGVANSDSLRQQNSSNQQAIDCSLHSTSRRTTTTIDEDALNTSYGRISHEQNVTTYSSERHTHNGVARKKNDSEDESTRSTLNEHFPTNHTANSPVLGSSKRNKKKSRTVNEGSQTTSQGHIFSQNSDDNTTCSPLQRTSKTWAGEQIDSDEEPFRNTFGEYTSFYHGCTAESPVLSNRQEKNREKAPTDDEVFPSTSQGRISSHHRDVTTSLHCGTKRTATEFTDEENETLTNLSDEDNFSHHQNGATGSSVQQKKKRSSDKDKNTAKSSTKEPVKIDISKYRLPTSFHYLLDKKLKEETRLDRKDYSSIARGLSKTIEQITLHPHSDSIRCVVFKFLDKYPNAVIQDHSDTCNFIVWKIQRQFEEKRRAAKVQYSNKGGRPKNSNSSGKGPGEGNVVEMLDEPEDRVSYEANVKKMYELVRNCGNSEAIRLLWKATFRRRRAELEAGKLDTIDAMLKFGCPLLNQAAYLVGEMDLILGEGTCERFLNNWLLVIPRILKFAFKNMTPNIKKVLANYEKKSLLFQSKENSSCAALEVLPLLTVGRDKTLACRSHFFDARLDTENLSDAIKKPNRSHPFLLKIGSSFHVVADGVSLIRAKDSRKGLLYLFCVLYAFNIRYSPKVEPSFLFIQSQVLKKEDKCTKSCSTMNIFANQIADANISLSLLDSSDSHSSD